MYNDIWGFPSDSILRYSPLQCRGAGDTGSVPWSGTSPGGGRATHSSILAGKPHRHRSLAGYCPWGRKESDAAEVPEHACLMTYVHRYYIVQHIFIALTVLYALPVHPHCLLQPLIFSLST